MYVLPSNLNLSLGKTSGYSNNQHKHDKQYRHENWLKKKFSQS